MIRSARVITADWLGEMPDQDAGAQPVLRITTDLADAPNSAFYMDVIDPRPRLDDHIQWGDRHVWWGGVRYRKHGLSFDPSAPLH